MSKENFYNPNTDVISYPEFMEVMNALNDVFPGVSSQVKLKFYWWAFKKYPMKAARDVSITIITANTKAPTPKEVGEKLNEWAKANKTYSHDDTPVPIDCRFCNDIGINYLERIEDGVFYGLMRCDCKTHITQELNAPTWDNSLKATFKRKSCPIEWFKPKEYAEGMPVEMHHLWPLVTEFKNKKRQAEIFWANMGFK